MFGGDAGNAGDAAHDAASDAAGDASDANQSLVESRAKYKRAPVLEPSPVCGPGNGNLVWILWHGDLPRSFPRFHLGFLCAETRWGLSNLGGSTCLNKDNSKPVPSSLSAICHPLRVSEYAFFFPKGIGDFKQMMASHVHGSLKRLALGQRVLGALRGSRPKRKRRKRRQGPSRAGVLQGFLVVHHRYNLWCMLLGC